MRWIPGGGAGGGPGAGAGAALVVVVEREKQPEQTVAPAKTIPRAKNFIMQVPQVKDPAPQRAHHSFRPRLCVARLQYLVSPPPLVAPLAQSSLIRCFSMDEELVAPL